MNPTCLADVDPGDIAEACLLGIEGRQPLGHPRVGAQAVGRDLDRRRVLGPCGRSPRWHHCLLVPAQEFTDALERKEPAQVLH